MTDLNNHTHWERARKRTEKRPKEKIVSISLYRDFKEKKPEKRLQILFLLVRSH